MSLNKAIGNMYPFLNDYPYKNANRGYTINFVKGVCPFLCNYCYYQSNPRYKKRIGKLRLDEKEFKTNLGKNNFIFVGSSIDMWAEDVPAKWIIKTLEYCRKFDNKYLFQTKNPKRFKEFIGLYPKNIILGTTIESNRATSSKTAPTPFERVTAFSDKKLIKFEKMISLEPLMDFDDSIITWIKQVPNLKFVSIGANSKKYVKLPEPSKEKIEMLIEELKKFTEFKVKSNLKRLRG